MAKIAKCLIGLFSCAFVLNVAAFDFGSVQTIEHFFTPSNLKSPLKWEDGIGLFDSGSDLLPHLQSKVRNHDGDVQLDDDFADKEIKELNPVRCQSKDPLFNYWALLHAGSGKAIDELYQSYLQLTDEEKNLLRRQLSIFFEGFKHYLIYGPFTPAKGETSEQYLQSQRIVPPSVLRLLRRYLVEAYTREWLKEQSKLRGDGYQQELTDSEKTSSRKGDIRWMKNPPDRQVFTVSVSSSKRKTASASGSSSKRKLASASGAGGEPYRPSGVTTDHEKEPKKKKKSLREMLIDLKLQKIKTKADNSCMFHAISAQLPLLEYDADGMTLRALAVDFLTQMQEKALPPNLLVPDIHAAMPLEELFYEKELINPNRDWLENQTRERFYMRMIASFDARVVVPGIPEHSTEFPGISSTASKIWGDENHYLLLNQMLYFYLIIFSKVPGGACVIIIPPGGKALVFQTNEGDSVNRLFDKISKENRTLTLKQFSEWFENERQILEHKLAGVDKESVEHKVLSDKLGRLSMSKDTTGTKVLERPVVLLYHEGDLEAPHYSQLNFDNERNLRECYQHNFENEQLMYTPDRLRDDVLSWVAGAKEKKRVESHSPEVVDSPRDSASEPEEKEELAQTNTPKKKRNKKKKKKAQSNGKETENVGFVVEEISFTDDTTPASAPESEQVNRPNEKELVAPRVDTKDGADSKHKKTDRTSRKKKGRGKGAAENVQKTSEEKKGKNGKVEPAPQPVAIEIPDSSSQEMTILVSQKDEKADIQEASEWLLDIDTNFKEKLAKSRSALEQELKDMPDPTGLADIMEQGLVKTSIALKLLDAEVSEFNIYIQTENLQIAMPLIREAAIAHLCPYGALLYGVLNIPDNSFSEKTFSETLMPLLQAAIAGANQGYQLAGAMLLNYHPAGYPQIALWNELLNLVEKNVAPLNHLFHIKDREPHLLVELQKDSSLAESLAIMGEPDSQAAEEYPLARRLWTTEDYKSKDLPVTYAKTRALLRLLRRGRSAIQPASGQANDRYWKQALILAGISPEKSSGKSRKKASEFEPVRGAIPLASSDLALYSGVKSLKKAGALIPESSDEHALFQQFMVLYDAINLLVLESGSRNVFEQLDADLASSRLYKSLFFIRAEFFIRRKQEAEAIEKENARIKKQERKIVREIKKTEEREEAIRLHKGIIETLFNRIGDPSVSHQETMSLLQKYTEKYRRQTQEKIAAKNAAASEANADEDDEEFMRLLLMESGDFARRWLEKIDQQISLALNNKIPASMWLDRAKEIDLENSSSIDRAVAGYFYFMAALKQLNPDLTPDAVNLQRLSTELPKSDYETIHGYLMESRKYHFPYAPLLLSILEAYGSPLKENSESFQVKTDFYLKISEWLFDACWAGVEQCYSMQLKLGGTHPFNQGTGITALFLRFYEQHKPRHSLVFNVRHDEKMLMQRPGYQMLLFISSNTVIFDGWLSQIKRSSLSEGIRQGVAKLHDRLEAVGQVLFQNYGSERELNQRYSSECDLRTLSGLTLEDISFWREFQITSFVDRGDFLWLVEQQTAAKDLCVEFILEAAAGEIPQRQGVQREFFGLLHQLVSKVKLSYELPDLNSIKKDQLESLLLLSDPFVLHPRLIERVHTILPGMAISSRWRSRLLLLHQQLAKGKTGSDLSLESIPLVKSVSEADFHKEELQLNAVLWKEGSESQYPSLVAASASNGEQHHEVSDNPEIASNDQGDLVDIERWRREGDDYFVECYKRAQQLSWPTVNALAKKYSQYDPDGSDAVQSMKHGFYHAVLGLLKLKAVLTPEEDGFTIDMMGDFNEDDLTQANRHFVEARVTGFPYGAYLTVITTIHSTSRGYMLELLVGDKGRRATRFDAGLFYLHVVSRLIESAIAGSRQAVLDLAMLFSIKSHRPLPLISAGLPALLIQLHLVMPNLHMLSFNVINSTLSKFIIGYFRQLNGEVREILRSGLSCCVNANDACFVQEVRQQLMLRPNLPVEDIVFIKMLLALMTGEPDEFLDYVQSPEVKKDVPPKSLPVLVQWQRQLDSEYLTEVQDSPSDIDTCSFALRFLGDTLGKVDGLNIQNTKHQKLIKVAGKILVPLLYGCVDPFVTDEKTRNELVKSYGAEIPEIALWFSVHHFIRFLRAETLADEYEARKQLESMKALFKYSGRIRHTILRLGESREFYMRKKLPFN